MLATIVDIVQRRAATHTSKIALEFVSGAASVQRVSYGALWGEIVDVAARLRAAGLRPGDRVILIYPSGLRFPAAFLGVLLAGGIAVPIYPPGAHADGRARLRRVVSDSGASAVLAQPALAAELEPFAAELGLPIVADLAGESGGADAGAKRPDLPEVAYLQYTSGSTGTPKGVVITHANLVHNLAYIADCFGASERTVGVSWLPPYHDMGLIGSILCSLHVGATSVLMSPLRFIQRPLRWLEAISDHRATVSGGPNFAFDLCVAKIDAEQRRALDLSSWEVAFNGAERVRASTLRRFAEAFAASGFRAAAFLPCYGLAESTLMVSGGHLAAPPDHDDLVSCGDVAAASGDVRILAPGDQRSADPDRAGEILVASPSVAAGYWGRPAETAETFRILIDGKPFLRTGDLGFLRDGCLHVAGRSKEIIIIRGRNYYPPDLEAAIDGSDPALAANACAAFGVEDGGDGERLVIVQEVARNCVRTLDAAAAIAAIRSAVARAFDLRPSSIALVRPGTLARTTNGKLRRTACRAAFEDGALDTIHVWRAEEAEPAVAALPLAGDARAGDRAAVRDWLLALVAREAGVAPADLDARTSLAELGLDSLQQAAIAGELSEAIGIEPSPQLLEDVRTIDALATYVAAVRAVRAQIACLPAVHRGPTLLALAEDAATQPGARGDGAPGGEDHIAAFAEVRALADRRRALLASGAPNPYFPVIARLDGPSVTIEGREFLNFSSNDYLGLAMHPDVVRAAQAAIATWGTSASASRIVAGERPVHRCLEAAIAAFLGVDDALVFVGGNTANVSTVGHLLGHGDLVVYDERSHDSLLKGIALSHAHAFAFRHNSAEDAERVLRAKRSSHRRALLFVEGIYSMDGDVPDLPRFIELKQRYRALLMVDECLSIGVLGATGRGIGEHFGVAREDVDIWMGGISKALASCGGYIAGSRVLVDYLRYTAPGFIFTTGIPPASAAAALAALETLGREPWRVQRLHENARELLHGARALGFETGTSGGTQTIPILACDPGTCMAWYGQLREAGINVQPVFAPAVPEHTERLRFFVTCLHTKEDLGRTLTALATLRRRRA